VQIAASCRLMSHFPGRGFLVLSFFLFFSVCAVDSDVSLLVANETLALLFKPVDLLFSEVSNLRLGIK
jgi:hypothetical protein